MNIKYGLLITHEIMSEWDWDKNKDLDLTKLRIKSGKKAWWICTPNNHNYQCIIGEKTSGRGCPICAGRFCYENSLESNNPELCKEFHPFKNTKQPNQIHKNCTEKYWWQCKEDITHEWQATASNRNRLKRGCPFCARMKRVKPLERFLEQANLKYNFFYDYTQVIYVNSCTPIIIICPVHGEFYQRPDTHLNSEYGCKKCYHDSTKFTTEQFIEIANLEHNFFYDYSKVEYTTIREQVLIICPEHGEFLQKAGIHLGGSGCPKCKFRFSKTEDEFFSIFEIHDNLRHVFIRYDKNKFYYVDAIIINNNDKIFFEFDGTIWHGDPRKCKPDDRNPTNNKTYLQLYENTMQKRNDYHFLGYRTISIWEEDWNEFRNDNELIEKMKLFTYFWIENSLEQHLQITKLEIEKFIKGEAIYDRK